MSLFLKLFNTTAEYNAYTADTENFILPNVSYCKDRENVVHYNPYIPPPHDYSQDYLTFTATESGTFKFSGDSINYSLDNGETWTSLASNTDSPTISAGSKILWKATLSPSTFGIGTFCSTSNFTVEGNAMSLLFGDDFKGQTSLSKKNRALSYLFSGNTNVVSCENLSLPATALSERCYQNMFQGCTSLTTAPELPATTLTGEFCYASMFNGCTSLTTAPVISATTLSPHCCNGMFIGCTSLTIAPELPATTLDEYCYIHMFNGCTSLTTAPVLSASTLVQYCYNQMFYGCSNLNSITCLATNISADYCTKNWVSGVSSSGTFTKAASMSDWTTGNNGIPSNWNVQDAS